MSNYDLNDAIPTPPPIVRPRLMRVYASTCFGYITKWPSALA
jgi:hypothetical protein